MNFKPETGRKIRELADLHKTLDSRYDDLKSGKVKAIPGEEVFEYFRRKSAAARRLQSGS